GIALFDRGAKRLLRQQLRQELMLAGLVDGSTNQCQRRQVGSEGRASLVEIRFNSRVPLVECNRREAHAALAEVLLEALLRGTRIHHANARTTELEHARYALCPAHHDGLAVEEQCVDEPRAEV